MIQIYSPGNTNFEQNGDMTLFPEICEAPSKLGGAWTLEITHPIDDEGRWKYIEREAVLSVPTFMGENQLYRIDQITDKNDVDISAKAYPIFYDAADEVFLMDKRPEAKNGQETLDILTEGTKYSGESNITAGNTAYFVRRNLIDCLCGDKSPSFVGTWGGEPLYQNYKVILNERAGGDYGAEVRYGKNMVGVNVQEDMSAVVTRIVPVAYNGRLLSSESVDSPLIKKYAKVYTKEIKFEDVRYFEDIDEGSDTTDLIVCNSQAELDAALIAKCNEQFEAGIDLYKVTIDVDLVSLENTEEYKDFKDLVKIGLGDDVSCYHTRLGIETKARAIKIVWDCITDSVKNVMLGDYQYDFLKRFNSTMEKVEHVLNEDGSVGAQYVKGVLNAMNTQLRYQKTIAQKQEVRAMLFEDLDPESPMFGAMAYGTQGLQIANKRTADGRDWDWSTAITANGAYADVLVAGILADKTGKTFWNLDTGEFYSEKINATINELNIKASNVQERADLANSKIDTLEIGGTNLLRGTNTLTKIGSSTAESKWTDGNWRSASSGTGTRSVIAVTDSPNGNIKVGIELANTASTANMTDIAQNYVPVAKGVTYTLSCYARGTGELRMQYGASVYVSKNYIMNNVTNWTRYSFTFALDDTEGHVSTTNTTNIYFGNRRHVEGATIQICGMKLEVGTIATDWTPSPEDVEIGVTNAQTTADSAKTTADSTETRVAVAESLIQQLSDCISMLVTDGNGASLMTQTENGWTFNMQSTNAAMNELSNSLNDLQQQTGSTQATVNALQSAVNDLGVMSDYVTVSTIGKNLQTQSASYTDRTVALGVTNVNMPTFDVKENTEYTVSFDVKSKKAYNGTSLLVQYYNERPANGGTRQSYEYVSGNVTTEYTRLSKTVTTPSGIKAMCIGLRSGSYPNTYKNVKVEIGNTATEWSPAPEDLDMGNMGAYYTEPCIELGKKDSEFKVRITNTSIQFISGSGVPAYMTSESLNISKANIDELQQGSWVWKQRSNGNYGLQWKGVSS